jgi:hypothetical protein
MGDELIIFSPKGKTFSFNFTKDTCGQLDLGKCSDYCNTLSLVMNDTFLTDTIVIVRHSCGHYDFSNGQHRTCIAGHLGLTVQAEVYEVDELCDDCYSDTQYNLVTF